VSSGKFKMKYALGSFVAVSTSAFNQCSA